MKANEAPEKIYIHPTLDNLYGMCKRSCDSDIEYTRTDAFIDKASEWLINHNDYICGSTNGIVKYDMKQLVEDFKKYMEE